MDFCVNYHVPFTPNKIHDIKNYENNGVRTLVMESAVAVASPGNGDDETSESKSKGKGT